MLLMEGGCTLHGQLNNYVKKYSILWGFYLAFEMYCFIIFAKSALYDCNNNNLIYK